MNLLSPALLELGLSMAKNLNNTFNICFLDLILQKLAKKDSPFNAKVVEKAVKNQFKEIQTISNETFL